VGGTHFLTRTNCKILAVDYELLVVVLRETRSRRKLSGGADSKAIQTKTAGELIVFITDDPPYSLGYRRRVTKRRPEFI